MRYWMTGCMLAVSAAGAALPTNVTFVNYFSGVTLSRPLYFAEVPGRDSNYVVLEQQKGLASVLHRRNGAWVKDTLAKVSTVSNNTTLGLLGFAFHPNFAATRKYYLFYSQNSTTNILEERQADTSLIKDAGVPARTLLTVPHASATNNGGNMAFGPADGYLYLGIGDGGDPEGDGPNRGQNPDTLLGKFLRIDVDSKDSGKEYHVPANNPFVGNPAYRPEIWALGLRSPWRWSFDALTGTLWVSDVGNATAEEVDTLPRGANMGWRLMEGFGCQPGVTCDPAGMTLPLATYGHSGGDNAIIGGAVYRGNPASPFYGAFFYGDNGSGKVRAMKFVNGVKTDSTTMTATVSGLSSFGTDSKGSLYAMSVNTNIVYRLTSTDLQPAVTALRPDRRTAKALPPIYTAEGLAGLKLLDLQGRRVSPGEIGNGLYVLRSADNVPALVPLLK